MDDKLSTSLDHLGKVLDHARRELLYTTPTAIVCKAIAAEPVEKADGYESIASRFDCLTKPLALEGADALRERDGVLDLTAHLRTEARWLAPAIDLLDEQLRIRLWAGQPWIAFRPLLLVGRPGCGKSHLARLIAQRSGTGFSVLDLGGTSDNRAIEGTARGWLSAQPCFAALAMSQSRTANPIVVLEEIDKTSPRSNAGDPLATLLTMIERSTAKAYYDKCLLATIDLSHVNWVLTANDASNLPTPLRTRLDIVEVAGPGPEHFDSLLGSLFRDVAKRWAIPAPDLPDLHLGAETLLRERFGRHRSVRRLARELEAALSAAIPLMPRSIQ